MNIGNTLLQLRERKGVSQADVASALSAQGSPTSNKNISAWETNRTKPNIIQFLLLGKYYDIPDFLSIFTDDYKPSLNDEGMQKLEEYKQLLIASGMYKVEPVRIEKFIRLYDLPVSAGTGEFLDGESYDEISVTDAPDGTDYALRISGDSMEPKCHDGQIVYCHKQDTLENGEIGIFVLNDKGYCKRLEQNQDGTFLISLKKKYAPIPVRDEDVLIVAGKVTGCLLPDK